MKKFTIALALMLCAATGFAQKTTTTKRRTSGGDNMLLNFGVGLTNYGIPVYLGLEGYVHPDITVGGILGYQRYSDGWRGWDYHVNVFTITALGNYHFNRIMELDPQWDLYAGLNLGYAIWSSNTPEHAPSYDAHSSGLMLGLQVGGRYYFSNKWGINAEIAGGSVISAFRIGATCRF